MYEPIRLGPGEMLHSVFGSKDGPIAVIITNSESPWVKFVPLRPSHVMVPDGAARGPGEVTYGPTGLSAR